MTGEHPRLAVASNRLPVTVYRAENGHMAIHPGSGGLVTALAPVLQDRGGLWIGWLGNTDCSENEAIAIRAGAASGYTLIPVELTARDIEKYYSGFSTEVIWFLFHDLPSLCRFEPDYWTAYVDVNRKFAHKIASESRYGDFIWVHDYHLMLVGRELKSLNQLRQTAFFLHIPFPPVDVFVKLPWRRELLQGLLEYDLIGFQTWRDLRNFAACVRPLIPGARFTGSGVVQKLKTPDRDLRVGAFPVGIDFAWFAWKAGSPPVVEKARELRQEIGTTKLILGIDRLDYTKGLPRRLHAFGDALDSFPELQGNVTYLQVVVPSRLDMTRYQDLKAEVERTVSEINGRFSRPGWTPVQYMFRPLSTVELVAYYRIADVAFVTPLKDGMNLVAKEFCACKVDNSGALILSEFAGAAAQMRQSAILVNPYDMKGMAAAIHRAITMDESLKRRNMQSLRRGVRRTSVFRWVDSFLAAAISKSLKNFPRTSEHEAVHAFVDPSDSIPE